MTITTLVAAVVEDTGRVDKSTLIARYVRAAILKCHEIDFFPRDIVRPAVVTVSPAGSLEFTVALPSLWRKFKSIVPCTSAGVGIGDRFTLDETDYTNALEAEDKLWSDFYSVKGETVYFNASIATNYLRWEYYAYPDLAADSATTWLADLHPQAIIDLATGYVEKKIGNTAKGDLNIKLFKEDWLPQIRQQLREEL